MLVSGVDLAQGHWLKIPRFHCMHFSVWTYTHYSNTSSPTRPCGSHRCQTRRTCSLPFPYPRESQWQDEECWIYCHLHVIFLFQEEIFHLEPGKVESGKGKCSYDPKLNSVSALISEYYLVMWGFGRWYYSVNILSKNILWDFFGVSLWPSSLKLGFTRVVRLIQLRSWNNRFFFLNHNLWI